MEHQSFIWNRGQTFLLVLIFTSDRRNIGNLYLALYEMGKDSQHLACKAKWLLWHVGNGLSSSHLAADDRSHAGRTTSSFHEDENVPKVRLR